MFSPALSALLKWVSTSSSVWVTEPHCVRQERQGSNAVLCRPMQHGSGQLDNFKESSHNLELFAWLHRGAGSDWPFRTGSSEAISLYFRMHKICFPKYQTFGTSADGKPCCWSLVFLKAWTSVTFQLHEDHSFWIGFFSDLENKVLFFERILDF